jgi:hypothetical protein
MECTSSDIVSLTSLIHNQEEIITKLEKRNNLPAAGRRTGTNDP